MAKYECIRGVVTSNGPVAVGEIVELSEHEAKVLAGKFVLVKNIAIENHNATIETEITTNVVEDVVHRDPVRRGRKPKNVA